MKGEHGPGAWLGIQTVGEAGLGTGGLVGERKWLTPGGQAVWEALDVLCRLSFDASEGHTGLLRLDDPGRLSVHVEQVIRKAVPRLQRKLADGDAPASVNVSRIGVAHDPACQAQQPVDGSPSFLLCGHCISPTQQFCWLTGRKARDWEEVSR